MLHNPYSNHYFQVPSPHSPYLGDIPNGVCAGKQIFVSGHADHHCDAFSINLETADGIALHFNPRFTQGEVIRNSMFHNSWGPEETHGSMPFHRGQHFEVIIKVDPERFLIAVNGQHQYEFQHRVSFEDITHLSVKGNIHLQSIVFSGGHGPKKNKHLAPEVPFNLPLHRAHPGKLIQISGDVHPHCGRFVVNLQHGEGGDSHNVALHLSVRFDDPYTQNAIVVSNRHHGNWGHELRDHGSFPFHKGAPFDLLILIEQDEFKIAVNGRHLTQMAHRNSIHDATHIRVEGDVSVKTIREY